ncbi:MAG: dihydrofolate reductase family protein [Ghiorsea sp.]
MIQQLFPINRGVQPLEGSYLDLNLHQHALDDDVFIYANYISSLDGRIALYDATVGEYTVPESIANKRDWRLYQELAGQADVMITSARYFRQLADNKAQDLLPVGSDDTYADIKAWREEQGLKSQPDVVVLSHSLDIPIAALAKVKDRQVIVLTSSQDADKIVALEQQQVSVIQNNIIDGAFIRTALIKQNYKSAYMIAGPKVFHTLVQDEVVNELFLTSNFSLLGGGKMSTVLDEDLPQASTLKLLTAYLDEGGTQMFQRFTFEKIGDNDV